MSNWPSKDPDDVLDYKIDWSARLSGDAIVSSEWIVPDGIESSDESFDEGSTTIWLSGGTLGRTFLLTNRVTTEGGRTMDKSASISIRNA